MSILSYLVSLFFWYITKAFFFLFFDCLNWLVLIELDHLYQKQDTAVSFLDVLI